MSEDELDGWISQLKKCEYLNEAQVKKLCAKAREILVEEANVLQVSTPIKVCKIKSSQKEGKKKKKKKDTVGGARSYIDWKETSIVVLIVYFILF